MYGRNGILPLCLFVVLSNISIASSTCKRRERNISGIFIFIQLIDESKLHFVVMNIRLQMSSTELILYGTLNIPSTHTRHLLTVMFGEEWYSRTDPRVPSHLTLIEPAHPWGKPRRKDPHLKATSHHTLARLSYIYIYTVFFSMPKPSLPVYAHM